MLGMTLDFSSRAGVRGTAHVHKTTRRLFTILANAVRKYSTDPRSCPKSTDR